MLFTFVLSIWMIWGQVEKCHALLPDILPAIMDELKIYQPIILSHKSTSKEVILKFVKNLSFCFYSASIECKSPSFSLYFSLPSSNEKKVSRKVIFLLFTALRPGIASYVSWWWPECCTAHSYMSCFHQCCPPLLSLFH